MTNPVGKNGVAITPELLRTLLDYDPATGGFIWKKRNRDTGGLYYNTWNTRFAGKKAMAWANGNGYFASTVFRVKIFAHRAAFAHYYGYWPEKTDHINGICTDNRIKNLRDVDSAENNKNMAKASNNTSGVTGVDWHKQNQKWRAQIRIDNRRMHIGCFESFNDAVQARKDAEKKYGFHANHGRDDQSIFEAAE